LVLALITMAAGYVLNIWIVPASFTSFREFQFEIRNRVAAFLLQEGVFTSVSDNLTVYIRSRDPDGALRGILVDDARNPASHATILAETGRLIIDQGTPRVLLLNGTREELDHQTGRLNVLAFGENTVDLHQEDRAGGQRFRDPGELSLNELLNPVPGSFSEHDTGRLLSEAHRRLSNPFTMVGYTLIALVSVLMGTFRRYGGLVRPFIAILTVVALVASGLAINNLVTRQPVLLPLIWLHAILPGLLAGWLLFGPQLRLMPETLQIRLGAT